VPLNSKNLQDSNKKSSYDAEINSIVSKDILSKAFIDKCLIDKDDQFKLIKNISSPQELDRITSHDDKIKVAHILL
jgi:hypothetical protein